MALVELAILPSERYECSGDGPSLLNRIRRHAYTACLRHPALKQNPPIRGGSDSLRPFAVGQATGAAGALAAASTDELVRRLFDPLAARLKAELRLDRERAGFVTDLRR